MQPFTCPQCGAVSEFDPRVESARCPRCSYSPAGGVSMPLQRRARGAQRPRRRRAGTHQRFLDELLSHWAGSHRPDRSFQLSSPEAAQAFFFEYQRAMGEDPLLRPGAHMRFVRSYRPDRRAILWFAGAYLMLRHGQRAQAAEHLYDLTRLYPEFPDAWIWLTATIDDPQQRLDLLENAVVLEPAHPLARDALALAQGKVAPGGGPLGAGQEPLVRLVDCPQCGGHLEYRPGATEVTCQYCGHIFALEAVDLLEGEARLVGDLQLRRRLQGRVWQEVQCVVRCQSCGAELIMSGHLARQCLFCDSTSVLVEEGHPALERPDGFLPFGLDEEAARAALDRAQRSAGQRLRAWWSGKAQVLTALRGVYLPFWVFDGFVEVRASLGSHLAGDGSWLAAYLDRSSSDGSPVLSKQLMMFDNLLFLGTDSPPPSALKKVLPYDMERLVPYDPHLLANWPAALYRVDVEEAVEGAYDAMLSMAVWRAGSLLTAQAGDPAQLRRTFQVTTVTYQLVLLPVWVALVQREEQRRLAVINGQTGKTVFSAPLKAAGGPERPA